jgi:hypothetical protein
MKHIFTFFSFLFILGTAHAQAPQGIPYQAAARNSSGAILASTSVSVRFTIRDSITNGIIKYRETHSTTTDANGMFSLTIGQGTPLTGTFSSIKWGTNAKFMQVELDPAGGSSYTDMGTQQMMSVPYALNAGAVKLIVSATGDTLYSGNGNYVIIPGISAANTHLTIGMSYGGGKIAYILQPGDPGYIVGETHGLIAAPSDQSTGIQWGCFEITVGGTYAALGTGAANTAIVSTACGAGTAARLCADLVLGGYSDWHLPSINELIKLYINRIHVGGFSTGHYWSSSESNAYFTSTIDFIDGDESVDLKNHTYYVRAVRAF